MSALRLVRPSVAYRDCFLVALAEYRAEGRYLDLDAADFERYVRGLLDREDRARLGPGRVPETVWWGVDEHGYAGRISLRHELTDALRREGGHVGYEVRPARRRRGYGHALLRLALPHARALDLAQVTLTCDDANEASWHIIEAAGGVLEATYDLGDGVLKRRYKIAP